MANNIELYNGNAFPASGTNFTDDQIKNHCSLKSNESKNMETTPLSDKERETARKELLDFRDRVKKEAFTKLRSRIMEQIKDRGFNKGFDEIQKMMHSDQVTLRLCQAIFYGCFTFPEINKKTLFVEIAESVCDELGIAFRNAVSGPSCIVKTVIEALHTVRKPFMQSGKPKHSHMHMKTRNCNEWPGALHQVGTYEFAYHKLAGWRHLITVDEEARKIWDENCNRPPLEPKTAFPIVFTGKQCDAQSLSAHTEFSRINSDHHPQGTKTDAFPVICSGERPESSTCGRKFGTKFEGSRSGRSSATVTYEGSQQVEKYPRPQGQFSDTMESFDLFAFPDNVGHDDDQYGSFTNHGPPNDGVFVDGSGESRHTGAHSSAHRISQMRPSFGQGPGVSNGTGIPSQLQKAEVQSRQPFGIHYVQTQTMHETSDMTETSVIASHLFCLTTIGF